MENRDGADRPRADGAGHRPGGARRGAAECTADQQQRLRRDPVLLRAPAELHAARQRHLRRLDVADPARQLGDHHRPGPDRPARGTDGVHGDTRHPLAGQGGGRIICCSMPVESQVFVPRPTRSTRSRCSLPVKNTVDVIDGEPIEIVDYLGISLLDLNSSAPVAAAGSSPRASRTSRRRSARGRKPSRRRLRQPRVLVNGEYQPAGAGGGGGGRDATRRRRARADPLRPVARPLPRGRPRRQPGRGEGGHHDPLPAQRGVHRHLPGAAQRREETAEGLVQPQGQGGRQQGPLHRPAAQAQAQARAPTCSRPRRRTPPATWPRSSGCASGSSRADPARGRPRRISADVGPSLPDAGPRPGARRGTRPPVAGRARAWACGCASGARDAAAWRPRSNACASCWSGCPAGRSPRPPTRPTSSTTSCRPSSWR